LSIFLSLKMMNQILAHDHPLVISTYGTRLPPNTYLRIYEDGEVEFIVGEYQFHFASLPLYQELIKLDPYFVKEYYVWMIDFIKKNDIYWSEFFEKCTISYKLLEVRHLLEYYMWSSFIKGSLYSKIVEAHKKYELDKVPFIKTNSKLEKMRYCKEDHFVNHREEWLKKGYGYGFDIYEYCNQIKVKISLLQNSTLTEQDVIQFFQDHNCCTPDDIIFDRDHILL